jgi:hypothetical protein
MIPTKDLHSVSSYDILGPTTSQYGIFDERKTISKCSSNVITKRS